MAYALRTRFKKEIVAEFFPPTGKDTGRVIVYAGGMPGMPSATKFMETYAELGYWVFFPRYRGTWESGGKFLKRSPYRDVVDVIDGLQKPFKSIWDDKTYKIDMKELFVFGSSFGGAAALLASEDERVNGVVAVSPVVEWRSKSKAEPLEWLRKIVRGAFGEGYRFSDKDWKKLSTGKFFNPAENQDVLEGSKILIMHAKDDDIINWHPVERFSKNIGAKLVLYKRGGHFGSSFLIEPRILKRVEKFLA